MTRKDALRDADEVLGRIRKDGGWDRRYRTRYEELPEPEPEVDPMMNVVKIAGLVIFMLVVWIAVLLWMAIGLAAQS